MYDPCLEARQKCTPKCAASCDTCAGRCVTDCTSCESACSDDACRRGCATKTATCRDRCMTSRQACLDTTCEDARRACSSKIATEWTAKGCAQPCSALTTCEGGCYERTGGDAACIKRCETTFLAKCSGTMMNVCTSGVAPQ